MTKSILTKIKEKPLPKHIAIIMDGNGRWAKKKGLSRVKGHKAGIKTVRKSIDTVLNLGINTITLYAFSTENWDRPKFEVSVLMTLLRQFIRIEAKKLMDKNIRLRVLGDLSKIPVNIREEILSVIEKTKNNKALNFNLALNYGSRNEILNAVKTAIKLQLDEKDITAQTFSQLLYTKGQEDPDLVIRTSGEKRISNFLLWQSAYAEFVFTDILWPDFNDEELYKCIYEFQTRERRFGGIGGTGS
jgi:undecaprenyl diphosphate synthase